MARPYPVPDELSQPFWDAANEGKLVIQRCKICRRYQHFPQLLCTSCGATELAFEPVSGRGRVYSYTIVHEARYKAFQDMQPYPIAQVELVEQPLLVLLSNLTGTSPQDVSIGMEVELFFEQIVLQQAIPQFRPIEAA